MASSIKDRDLKALQKIITQADLVLNTVSDSLPSIARLRELLKAAVALSKDLTERPSEAVELGAIGGRKTAERGPEYFKQIAAMRKNRAGGRPRKATS